MKKIVLLILILLIIIAFYSALFKQEPKKLVAKFAFGKEGKKSDEFKSLSDLVIKDDYLFVADSGNSRIQILKINPDGSLSPKSTFGKEGRELGEFAYIINMSIKDDYLFVADSGNSRIQILKINPDGSLSPKSTFGKEGRELGEFDGFSPLDLVIKDDYLFVADSGNSRIQILKINPDGSLSPKSTFGKEGRELGEFGVEPRPLEIPSPLSMSIKDDYLFVADSGNSRIQILKINPDGSLSPKSTFGKEGRELGEFASPYGLVIKDDYLFVADSGNSRIQILKINPDGSLSPKSTFGKEGRELGEFGRFLTTLGIRKNYLYVADTRNNRIQVLEIKY